MLETVRAFIALNLEVAAIRRVAALQKTLRTSLAAPPGRVAWVSPANMHLTMRFLGAIDPELAPALGDGMRKLVENLPPMTLELGPLDAFPSKSRARVLIVGVTEATGALQDLAGRMEAFARTMGFAPEQRPFRAHLTLGRAREPMTVEAWYAAAGNVALGEALATDVVLYSSELKRAGAEYTALQRVALAMPQRGQRSARSTRTSHRPRSRSKAPPATEAEPVVIPGPPGLPSMDPKAKAKRNDEPEQPPTPPGDKKDRAE